ncbi:MAG: LysE family transporter [Rhodobacteraceae bacterium]|nr:LysE family transporter [Paracoccaceae bacterium]
MFNLSYLAIGVGIGLITSIPVGPVNVMAIRHAVQGGVLAGVFVGAGAALADVIYASVAVLSVSAVTGFINGQEAFIKLAGAVLLIGFGGYVIKFAPNPERQSQPPSKGRVAADILAAFAMTITNPGAILGFVAIIGGLGSWRPEAGDRAGETSLILGVALGALLWWVFISSLMSHVSGFVQSKWLGRANLLSGLVLLAFGAGVMINLCLSYLL